MNHELDSIDLKIIKLLQEDAKITIKEISAKINMTSTPIYERIKRLERNGVIEGYMARINKMKIGLGLMAFCTVSLEAHHTEYIIEFEKDIQKLDEVFECYHLAGNVDYLLKIFVNDMDEYQSFIAKKLAKLNNIGKVQSSFVMKEIKNNVLIKLK